MLRKAYDAMMTHASHPKAVWLLGIIAFAESSFFPLPPDPLYMAMIISKRESAWRLALICTVSSVVGGVLGYYIGWSLYESVGKWIISAYGMEDSFAYLQHQFSKYGFQIIVLKALTPIPYKIVTISSGVVGFDINLFMLASLIARGFRFYLLAALLWYFGPSIKEFVDRNLTMVTIGGLSALIVGFVVLKYVI